jgi:hypothetical protein
VSCGGKARRSGDRSSYGPLMKRLAWVGTTALVALCLVGCGEATAERDSGRQLEGNFSVEGARGLEGFPVYYAGASVAGLPLTSVERSPITAPPGTSVAKKLRAEADISSVDFFYGSCIGAEGEGCNIPLVIQVWPACARYPALYGGLGSPVPSKATIRGVPAAYFEGGYRLEIQSGASTIVIFGRRDRMQTAVEALRGLNVDVKPGEPLPPPVPGALDGTLPC